VSASGALDVASARAIQEELLRALLPALDVVVNLDRVERLDGAGVQLLLAAKTFVERKGHAFALSALGAAAKRSLESCGVASLFAVALSPSETIADANTPSFAVAIAAENDGTSAPTSPGTITAETDLALEAWPEETGDPETLSSAETGAPEADPAHALSSALAAAPEAEPDEEVPALTARTTGESQ